MVKDVSLPARATGMVMADISGFACVTSWRACCALRCCTFFA